MTVYHFNMDNIINQSLQQQNSRLSSLVVEQSQKIKKLEKALNSVALPALKEYEEHETGSLQMIARSAMDAVLKILNR